MRVEILSAATAPQVVETLCDAFHEYPVMRHVLGDPADYDAQLETLIGFFVAARVLREDLMLGIPEADGSLPAAALVTLPRDTPPPEALAERREQTWAALGPGPRARYEAFGAAAGTALAVAESHHHLNMIGVRRGRRGGGHARALLERVHAVAESDPASAGVSLTTELEANLDLYRHFGYRVVGHARSDEGLETWAMFRPRG